MKAIINIKLLNEEFDIELSDKNWELVVEKLKVYKLKIINKLKKLKKQGKIKSITKPYTQDLNIRKEVENLVKTKRHINKNIEKINNLFK